MVLLGNTVNFSDFIELGINKDTTQKEIAEQIKVNLTLATPYKKPIGKITTAYNRELETGVGQLHHFSFNIPLFVDRKGEKVKNPEVENIEKYYLIKVQLDNILYSKWFRIVRVVKHGEEIDTHFEVECYTLESELADRRISGYSTIGENLFTNAHKILSRTHWGLAGSEQSSISFDGKTDYAEIDWSGSVAEAVTEATFQFWAYERAKDTDEGRQVYKWAMGHNAKELPTAETDFSELIYDFTKSYSVGDIIWYDGIFYEVLQDIAAEDEFDPHFHYTGFEFEQDRHYKGNLDELTEQDGIVIDKYIQGTKEFPKDSLKASVDEVFESNQATIKQIIEDWEFEEEDKIKIYDYVAGTISKADLMDYCYDRTGEEDLEDEEQQEQVYAFILGASLHTQLADYEEIFEKRMEAENALVFGRTLVGIGKNMVEIRRDSFDREVDNLFYPNSWTHWTLTYKYDNNTITYEVYDTSGREAVPFYSGKFEGVDVSDLPTLKTLSDMYIGATHCKTEGGSIASNFFKGEIDEIRIFNKHFTAKDVERTAHTRFTADNENIEEHAQFTSDERNAAIGIWQCKKGDIRNSIVQNLDEVFDHSGNERDLIISENQWYDDHVYIRNDQGEMSNIDFLFKHRDMEINDSNFLNAFTETFPETYNAVPVFITGAEKDSAYEGIERQLYFLKPEDIGTDRGLRFRYGVLLDTVEVEDEITDFCTRLRVFGKDNLTIAPVLPTGMVYMDNFYYFHYPYKHEKSGGSYNIISHSNFMSDKLAGAIQEYDELLEIHQDAKINEKLFNCGIALRNKKYSLDVKLHDLIVEKREIEDRIDLLQNEEIEVDYEKLGVYCIETLETMRDEKQDEIDYLLEYEDITVEVEGITHDIGQETVVIPSEITTNGIEGLEEWLEQVIEWQNLLYEVTDIERFFTEDLVNDGFFADEEEAKATLKEREQFIIEKTITNEYISDRRQLYEWGVEEFAKIAVPQLRVEMSVIDFINLVEVEHLWDKLRLGDTVKIYREDLGIDVKAEIMEMTLDLEEGDISLSISNVREVKSPGDKFIEAVKNSVSTSNEVKWEKGSWDKASEQAEKHDDILEGEWDAAARRITAGIQKKDQSVDISRRGIVIRNPNEPEKFLVAQNGIIGITSDGGKTYRHAIKHDGVVGERIVGRVIVGRNLHIVNQAEGENNIISINEYGLKAFRYDGENVEDAEPDSENVSFHIDQEGNAFFSGKLRVGGDKDSPNFIVKTDGTVKGGKVDNPEGNEPEYLFEITEGDAKFHGKLEVGWNTDAEKDYEFIMEPDEGYFKALWDDDKDEYLLELKRDNGDPVATWRGELEAAGGTFEGDLRGDGRVYLGYVPETAPDHMFHFYLRSNGKLQACYDKDIGKHLLELDPTEESPIATWRGRLQVAEHSDSENNYHFEVEQDTGRLKAIYDDSISDHHFVIDKDGGFFIGKRDGEGYYFAIVPQSEDSNYREGVDFIQIGEDPDGVAYLCDDDDGDYSINSYFDHSEITGYDGNLIDGNGNFRAINHAGFTKNGTFWAGVTPLESLNGAITPQEPEAGEVGGFIVPYNADGVYNFFWDGTVMAARWKLNDGTYIAHSEDRLSILFGDKNVDHSQSIVRFWDVRKGEDTLMEAWSTEEGGLVKIINDKGEIVADIKNSGSDLTEFFTISPRYTPDVYDIVVATEGGIVTTSTPYDKKVVGFYSDLSKMSMGEKAENTIPIGMTGSVKAKIKGAAEIGDFVVTSDTPGQAIATKEYIPGTVAGKVLEAKEEHEEKPVWVLIMPC